MNNNNRLGNKLSREKARPKSSERSKSLNKKSTEAVEEIVITEENEQNVANDSEQVDNEIEIYRIDTEQLKSIHMPQPPAEKPKKSVMVQKVVPSSKTQSSKPKKKVLVARPLQTDGNTNVSETIPLLSGSQSTDSKIKAHSILGSLEEFKSHVMKNELLNDMCFEEEIGVPQYKEDVQAKLDENEKEGNIHIDETNALGNWKKQMNERKKQQSFLAKHMKVARDMLVMNQSDNFRSVQEERTVIDRAMPSMNYGKGYRVGSEFWKQVEAIGGDDGISITLNETEQGSVPPIEHIGHASHIKQEMGTEWKETHRMTNIHYPWFKSGYLRDHKQQLQHVIDELDPHQPYIDGLEVIGKKLQSAFTSQDNSEGEADDEEEEEEEEEDKGDTVTLSRDPLSRFEDVIPKPIFGPSLIINGKSASWQGSCVKEADIGLTIRLLFKTDIGYSSKSAIDITNDGTTVVHFMWKKITEKNPFDLSNGKPLQRFYFSICNGMILPGMTISIPFFFKSPNSGIFTETWHLETQPVLCAGAKIEVVLRGISTEVDHYENERKHIEQMLQSKQNEIMMKRILADILTGIKTPPRPSTPLDSYLTEEDIFKNQNEKMSFKNDAITKLKCFYNEMQLDQNWDLSIDSLLKNVLNMDEEDQRESALQMLNNDIQFLNAPPIKPIVKNNYNACYQTICESIDKFVLKSMNLRVVLGLPVKELVIIPKVVATKKNKKPGDQKQSRADSRNKKESPLEKRGKTPMKDKGKNDALTVNNGKTFPDSLETEMAAENISTDLFKDPSYCKYMEKMYIQVYNCLSEMADNIETILSA